MTSCDLCSVKCCACPVTILGGYFANLDIELLPVQEWQTKAEAQFQYEAVAKTAHRKRETGMEKAADKRKWTVQEAEREPTQAFQRWWKLWELDSFKI